MICFGSQIFDFGLLRADVGEVIIRGEEMKEKGNCLEIEFSRGNSIIVSIPDG
jgi:hypothetical protein